MSLETFYPKERVKGRKSSYQRLKLFSSKRIPFFDSFRVEPKERFYVFVILSNSIPKRISKRGRFLTTGFYELPRRRHRFTDSVILWAIFTTYRFNLKSQIIKVWDQGHLIRRSWICSTLEF